ncbi:hypothetical protein GTY67_18950 [Streptomyces sp. SID8374]|uniref:hypothetical protein n=1 Tax=Streptomyces sp. SID8374 TaxID=2690354 RepID=UPI001368AE1C|nr:hypothetical protein [Streptomyces sp. SID8374]MYX15439.1 hypothetical protein [Streptomyces sp. SID8374]
MSEQPQGRKGQPIEGRAELDAAWSRFRRAMIRLAREGHRSDPGTLAKLKPIVAEATAALDRLTSEAHAAENASVRNRRLLEAEEQRLGKLLRKSARQGSPGAVRMLRQMDEGRPDDAA